MTGSDGRILSRHEFEDLVFRDLEMQLIFPPYTKPRAFPMDVSPEVERAFAEIGYAMLGRMVGQSDRFPDMLTIQDLPNVGGYTMGPSELALHLSGRLGLPKSSVTLAIAHLHQNPPKPGEPAK